MLTVYAYDQCSTCRAALAWLKQRGISCTVRPIRTQPPTPAELARMLLAQVGELRRLFNTSGKDYRALGLGAQLASLSQAEALRLLGGNGNLVKRPFVVGPGVGLVGFNAATWEAAFAGRGGVS